MDYVAMAKRMHESLSGVELHMEQVRGFLYLGKGRKALNKGVEQAQVPWVWPDPIVGEIVV